MGDEGVDGYISFWPRIDLKTGQARLDSQLTWLQRLVTQGKANDYVVAFNLSTPGEEFVTIGGYNSTQFTPNKDGKLPIYHSWVSQVQLIKANYERGTRVHSYDIVKMGLQFNKVDLKEGDDERLKFAYFEFDLDYIGIPQWRFK